MQKELAFHWSWTNWTFGIWWDKKKIKKWGIDFGPLEIIGKINGS